MNLPVIDLSRGERAVADAIDRACVEVGFFAVVGHGVDADVIDAAWLTTQSFFDLPMEDKLAARHPTDENHPYGYFPMGREALAASLGRSTPPDLKESFNLAPPASHTEPTGLFGGVPRIWPAALPDLRPAWERYYEAMADLAGRILQAMAVALRMAPTFFDAAIAEHLSALRGLNYPPLERPVQPGQLRAGEHSDYGTLTILLPGPGSGGLEVLAVDGGWVGVEPLAGGFVVNVGDMLAQWTNDRWRSTRHRVAVPAGAVARSERRQAIAFFHQPSWHTDVAPIPTCVSPERPARHEATLAGPWLHAKFRAASTHDLY